MLHIMQIDVMVTICYNKKVWYAISEVSKLKFLEKLPQVSY